MIDTFRIPYAAYRASKITNENHREDGRENKKKAYFQHHNIVQVLGCAINKNGDFDGTHDTFDC